MVEVKKHHLLAAPVATFMFVSLCSVTAAAQEAPASAVVINEVESNGDPIGDFVELANTDAANSLDISGWTLVDEKDENPVVLPAGTIIESGGYFVVYTDAINHSSTSNTYGGIDHFGLGKDDTVTLRDTDGTVVDTFSWKDLGKHAEHTYGRVPDMVGEFAETGGSTPGTKNLAAQDSGENPDDAHPTVQSPYHNVDVSPVPLGGAFSGSDMSGADFNTSGTAWITNNGTGDIYALAHDPQTNSYELAAQWKTTYPQGSGTLDAEGIVAAENGHLYVATERNNSDKNISRPSILKFTNPTGKEGVQVALQEWNLAEFTGPIGANGGLEAIAQLEDTIFAVGVEETGEVLVVDLASDNPVLLQRYDSPFEGVMALDYSAENHQLSVVCDEACDGASEILSWDGSALSATDGAIYQRPSNLGNWANEGFASYTTEITCTDGSTAQSTSYLWADDASTNDFNALNSAQVIEGDCKPATSNDDETPVTPGNNSSSGFTIGSTVLTLTSS